MSAHFFEQTHFDLKKKHACEQSEWTKERELLNLKIQQLEVQLKEFDDREKRLKKSQNLLMEEISKVDKSEEVKNTHNLLSMMGGMHGDSPRFDPEMIATRTEGRKSRIIHKRKPSRRSSSPEIDTTQTGKIIPESDDHKRSQKRVNKSKRRKDSDSSSQMLEIDFNHRSLKLRTEAKQNPSKSLTRSTEQIYPKVVITKAGNKNIPSLKCQQMRIDLGPSKAASKSKVTEKAAIKSGTTIQNRAYLGKDHNSHHLMVPTKVKEIRGTKKFNKSRYNSSMGDKKPTKVIIEPSEEVYAPQTEDEVFDGKWETAVFNSDEIAPHVPQTWRPVDANDRESDMDLPDSPDLLKIEAAKAFQTRKTNESLDQNNSPVKNPIWFGNQKVPPITLANSPKHSETVKDKNLQVSEKEKSLTTLWMSGSRLQLSINPMLEARERIKNILEQGQFKTVASPTVAKNPVAAGPKHNIQSSSPLKQRQTNLHQSRFMTSQNFSGYKETSNSSMSKQSSNNRFNADFKTRLQQPFDVAVKKNDRKPAGISLSCKIIGKSEILTILKLHRQLQEHVLTLADKFKEEQGQPRINSFH